MTTRVCEECGVNINEGDWGKCSVCDKDICRSCSRGGNDLWLCPANYAQVKEFINGLKEEGRMDWKLTDGEIRDEVKAVMQRMPGSTRPPDYMKERDRTIATAAVRKFAVWCSEPCTEHKHEIQGTPRFDCVPCWESFKQEVGL